MNQIILSAFFIVLSATCANFKILQPLHGQPHYGGFPSQVVHIHAKAIDIPIITPVKVKMPFDLGSYRKILLKVQLHLPQSLEIPLHLSPYYRTYRKFPFHGHGPRLGHGPRFNAEAADQVIAVNSTKTATAAP